MDREFLRLFFERLRSGLERQKSKINEAPGRFPKRQIFLALNDCRSLFQKRYECEVTSRWSVGKKEGELAEGCEDSGYASGANDTLILEYLVDYGICRHSIPQAIRQPKNRFQELTEGQKYRMLLAVESEMGTDDEVARDFLKLLDVKAPVKCLIFRKRKSHVALYERLSWVMAHHQAYDENESILVVGLPTARSATLTADEFEARCVENAQIVTL